jgi:TPR repeat protein
MLYLGINYEEGIGFLRHSESAIIWYEKAISAGNEEAKKRLKKLNDKMTRNKAATNE